MTKVEERHGRLEKARGKLLMTGASGQKKKAESSRAASASQSSRHRASCALSRPWELMAASVQPCHIHGLNAGTVYHIARWSQCKLPKKLQSLKIDHRRAKKICRINAVQKVWHADPTPYSQICPIKYGRFPTQSDRNFPHKTVTRSSERL